MYIFWSWFRCSPACAPCPKRHGWGNVASKMSPGLTYLLGQCPSAGLHQKATELNSSVMPCRPEIEILCVGGETHYVTMPPQDDVGQQHRTTTNCFVLVPRTYHPCCNGFENQVENSSRTFGCYLWWWGSQQKLQKRSHWRHHIIPIENVWIDLEWIKVPVTWNMTSKMNLANWILLLRLDPPKKTWPQPLRGSFFRWACDPVVWQDVIGGPTRSLVRWCQAECEMLARWRDAFRTDVTVLQGNIFGGPLHALYNIHLRHLRWNFTTSSSCWVRWDAPAHGTKANLTTC